ncbi:flavin reductase family protein [Tessaracoccus rhinocerotis]|uniref:Flavin reductase family protein n=1 Tax=Tessaracoccus rhinocerotis TaxID=1689449 RepID=A0A553K1S3_9ACTN|nr:flavin reductase family protein [Tessaracoccus rhinocerotis]TRY18658.1 flavin reductase family protein [Tessaracoccus rhinocerotis]
MDELAAAFREAMSRVSAPVTIVTTMQDGVPHGTTVSAFASLSVHPPMVLLALDNRGSLVGRIRQTGRLLVNVLAEDQAETAIRFATPALPDRFEGVDWTQDHGLPRLSGAAAWLRCEHVVLEPGGDHTVLLATVATAESAEHGGLTYYRRQFGSADRAISLP